MVSASHVESSGSSRLSLLVGACSLGYPPGSLADEPDRVPDDVVLLRDLRYREGASRSWTLDLAMPKEGSPGLRPAIVVIHGGGWIEGDKSSFSTVSRRPPGNVIDFARLGFAAATMNYRLSGEAPFPAALDDCRCAVRWLRANSQKYHN
ncbi:MAG TPA: alpha/beta hydrolase [Pirellulales bacterium]|nr:alpha/beta hydrolase [Pirellulales bacterium]